jgi:hypothetical protein
MTIRGERTWCAACQAPEVFPENLHVIDLFIDALPTYQVPGLQGGALQEGFDRGAVRALFDLHGIAAADAAPTWEALRELEAELRTVRTARQAQQAPPAGAGHGR